jgi:hypothetical protein
MGSSLRTRQCTIQNVARKPVRLESGHSRWPAEQSALLRAEVPEKRRQHVWVENLDRHCPAGGRWGTDGALKKFLWDSDNRGRIWFKFRGSIFRRTVSKAPTEKRL